MKMLVLLTFLIVCSEITNAQTSKAPWLEGSWGVRLIMYAGERLNESVADGYDYVKHARQINANYPTAGHVITNFSGNANGTIFMLRKNNYINVAGIDATMVPSLANEQIVFDVINELKKGGKKVILYNNYTPSMAKGTASQQANWKAYVNANYGGDYVTAYNALIKGYMERFKGLVDGYWIDNFSWGNDADKSAYVQMMRETDPNATIAFNYTKDYFTDKVDSDGNNDANPIDYKIIKYIANDKWSDYTGGHITPLAQGAPPNSWAYEEFTLTDMVASNTSNFSGNNKVLKHMFAPMREKWSSSAFPLMYNDKDQAYRFVRRITDSGGSITFSTTANKSGLVVADELAILKHVNDQLEVNADYVPYTRPAGAKLVGESTPNYHQIIDFQVLPNKDVNDADFTPVLGASSGLAVTLTSSNSSVATIVNGKIRIQSPGKTNITASQSGNNRYAAAENFTRQLTVTGGSSNSDNLALKGTATQSSNHPNGGGEAYRANDGNTDGRYSQGSVTRTSSEANSWWQVDLKSEYNIDTIKVFGRTDACCDTRLSNFDVTIIDANGNTTYTQTFTTAPSPSITINANGATGRIIRVQQNTGTVLNLAEVEVYGSEITPPIDSSNLALNGVASQSSTIFEGEASRAIDGNTNGAYSGGSVTHTNNDATPYWQVQLDSEYPIGDITIFGRTDACCLERLSNFTVMVYNEGTRTFLKTFQSYPDPSITVNAGGAVGNLIRIRSNTSQALSLAEVQVFEDIECLNFSTIQAQNYNSMSGIFTETTTDSSGNKHLGFINNGDWSKYDSVDLTCANYIEVRVSSKNSGGNIEVRLGGVSGQLIGTITVPSTKSWSSWTTVSANIDAVNDINDLYLVYKGGNGYLFNVNWIRFSNDQVKTHITSIGDQSQLFIYPNPVEDQVTIGLDTNETYKYTISDTTGKTIRTGVINKGAASVNIDGLSKGLYLLTVSNRSHILTGKIIKE